MVVQPGGLLATGRIVLVHLSSTQASGEVGIPVRGAGSEVVEAREQQVGLFSGGGARDLVRLQVVAQGPQVDAPVVGVPVAGTNAEVELVLQFERDREVLVLLEQGLTDVPGDPGSPLLGRKRSIGS